MPTELFKLPSPSSGRSHEEFKELGGHRCLLACHYSADGSDAVNLCFNGVETYKATFDKACSPEMIRAAYDKVVDLGATSWLREVSSELSRHNANVADLQHLMIYFDDGPCYEFVCRSFSPEAIAATSHPP